MFAPSPDRNDFCNDSMDFDMLDEVQERHVPKFNCTGRIGNWDEPVHRQGYVASGELERPPPWLFNAAHIVLFGRTFGFDEAFFSDTPTLLGLAKAAYGCLESEATGISRGPRSQGRSSADCRERLAEFLAYLRVYTHRFLDSCHGDDVIDEFYGLLLNVVEELNAFSGSIAEMPRVVFIGGGSSLSNGSAAANQFHAYLDLNWTLVQLTFTAGRCRSSGSRLVQDRVAAAASRLQQNFCGDLIYLASKQFAERYSITWPLNPRRQIVAGDWAAANPFHCSCVREAWLLLGATCVAASTSLEALVQRTYQTMRDRIAAAPSTTPNDWNEWRRPALAVRDPALPVWLLVHLARTAAAFDDAGRCSATDRFHTSVPAYEPVMNRLVQAWLAASTDGSATGGEERLRGLLACLHSLCQVWGANLSLCIVLWEHFSRKLDDAFNPAPTGVFDAAPYTSCIAWYEHLTCRVEPWKSVTPRYNSYFLFLRLLGYHLELMNAKGRASMAARICVKLHGKKLLELSRLGLYHLVSACLVVVLATDASDMCAKIVDVASTVGGSSKSADGLLAVAEAVLLLACARRGVDCRPAAESLAGRLERAARLLTDSAAEDAPLRTGQMYIDALSEVAVHVRPGCLDGALRLIGPELRHYLKVCGSCHRSAAVDVLAGWIRRKQHATVDDNAVYQAVAGQIWPLMRDHYVSEAHVDFFVQVALASLQRADSRLSQHLVQFWLDEKVNAKFSVRFLHALLDEPSFLADASLRLDNYQTLLIQAWCRLAFLLPSADSNSAPHLDAVAAVVRRLPRMAELTVRTARTLHAAGAAKSGNTFVEFLRTISAFYQTFTNYNERSSQRDVLLQYLGPLDKCLAEGHLLTTWEPSAQVHHVYRMAAELTFHCGNVIYTKGKADCLLAQLNNALLIPIAFYDSGRELPASVTSALQRHLAVFVLGLVRLNPQRDPYVSRCLTDVFHVYMHRYPPNETHPFTKCWTGLEEEPVTESLVPFFRGWLLQHIATSVLAQKTAKSSPYLAPTLLWLKWLCATHDWKVEIVQAILLPVLELALALEEITGKRSVNEFLRTALSGHDPDDLRVCERALKELVERHFAFNSLRLFRLMEAVGVLNGRLVGRLVPALHQQVHSTEAKRGTGADATLRQHMEKLEISLGMEPLR